MKSQLFNSSRELDGDLFFNHHPPRKAGPKIHGSIAKLYSFVLKTKQEWFKKIISNSMLSSNVVNLGIFLSSLKIIFLFFTSKGISFFFTFVLV